MMEPWRPAFALAWAVLFTAACGDPIADEWVSPDHVSYYEQGARYAPNRMTLGSDGTGKADIYYIHNADPAQHANLDQFEIEWEQEGSKSYRLTLDCFSSEIDGPSCDSRSFALDCEEGSDADALECQSDGGWENYNFLWEHGSSD